MLMKIHNSELICRKTKTKVQYTFSIDDEDREAVNREL